MPPVVSADFEPDIVRELTALWCHALKLDSVSPADNFFDLGGTSIAAAEIFGSIEARFGLPLSMSTIIERPTIRHLAELLAGSKGPQTGSILIPFRRGGSERPLFLIHPNDGHIIWYQDLCRHLAPDRPLYGLQYAGGGEPATIEALAARYLAEIRKVQPVGPYLLCGYSLGGVIALEMAQQLRGAGQNTDLLVAIDSGLGGYRRSLRLKLVSYLVEIRHRGFAAWLVFMAGKVGGFWRNTVGAAVERRRMDPATRSGWVAAVADLNNAYARYRPKPYAGPIHLIRAAKDIALWRHMPDLGWGKVAGGGLDVLDVQANHISLMQEPAVRDVAAHLDGLLNGSRQTKMSAE